MSFGHLGPIKKDIKKPKIPKKHFYIKLCRKPEKKLYGQNFPAYSQFVHN